MTSVNFSHAQLCEEEFMATENSRRACFLAGLRSRHAGLFGAVLAVLAFILQDAAILDQWLGQASYDDPTDYCRANHGSLPDSDHGQPCVEHCLRYQAHRHSGLTPPRPETVALRRVELGWASAALPGNLLPPAAPGAAPLPRGPPQATA